MEKDEKLGSLADVLAQAFCINVAVYKKKKQKETQNMSTIIQGPSYTQHIQQMYISCKHTDE